jgi:hypothetical protein
MKHHGGLRRKLITTALLALALVSSLNALSRDDMRQPLVKFIDFYLAAENAEAPAMSTWERIVYAFALAKAPERSPARKCGARS